MGFEENRAWRHEVVTFARYVTALKAIYFFDKRIYAVQLATAKRN